MGMPEQRIVIETAKEGWSFFQWAMGILGTIITGVSTAFIFKKVKNWCEKK